MKIMGGPDLLVIPWPSSGTKVSQNSRNRYHKRAVSSAKKAARELGANCAILDPERIAETISPDMAREVGKRAGEWALARDKYPKSFPKKGDIRLRITFRPPNRRWDRLNMPGLFKSHIDGLVEDAWGISDRRIHPDFQFGPPVPGGGVFVEVIDA